MRLIEAPPNLKHRALLSMVYEVAWYWWTLLSLNSGPLDRSHCVAFDPLCKVLYFVLVG